MLRDRYSPINYTNLAGHIDHGLLLGLADDDHAIYHTDARAAAWLAANHETTYTHTDIALNTTHRTSNGSDHTYINQDVTTTGTPTFTSVNSVYIQLQGTGNYGYGTSDIFEDLTDGTYNSCFGHQAGINITGGDYNVLMGYQAGLDLTDGSNNVCIGRASGENITTANSNVCIGTSTGASLITTEECVFVGGAAGRLTTGAKNLFFGFLAGEYCVTGIDNVAIGRTAMWGSSGSTRDMSRNVCIGSNAGYNLDTGDENVLIGFQTGIDIKTVNYNTLIGSLCGFDITSGNNVGIGRTALYTAVGGSGGNTAIGYGAMRGQDSVTKTPAYNTAIGYNASYYADSGLYNCSFGYKAGYLSDDDDYCIFIGPFSGYNQDGTSGLFIVDAGDMDGTARASAAVEATNSILYGVMAAARTDQTLAINAHASCISLNSVYIKTVATDNLGIGDSHVFEDIDGGGAGQNNVVFGIGAGINITTGDGNVCLGRYAGYLINTGDYNTIAGYGAGLIVQGGGYNVIFGYQTGDAITSGSNNCLIGTRAGRKISTTNNNMLLGSYSGTALTTSSNVGIGAFSLFKLSGGSGNNVAIGAEALYGPAVGGTNDHDYNIAIGASAGRSMDTGTSNTLIGYSTGYKLTSGQENVFIGHEAGYNQVTSLGGVYIGQRAGFYTTGAGNTLIGYHTAYIDGANDDFAYCTTLGFEAGRTLNSGDYNVILGFQSGYSLTNGESNIFLGNRAGYRQTTNSNLLIVDNQQRADIATEASNAILYGVMAAARTDQTLAINAKATCISLNGAYIALNGTGNIGISNETLFEDMAAGGTYNTVLGNEAGKNITTADYSVAIGNNALLNALTGGFNVAIGHNAAAGSGATKDYSNNLCIGSFAGYLLDTGDYNVFMGMYSGYYLLSGRDNMALGYYSLAGTGAGTADFSYNIGIGAYSGTAVDTGLYNTFIGYKSGYISDDDDYCIFLGPFAGYNQDGTNGLFIVDAGDQDGTARASAAAEATNSLLYGQMVGTPATQTLRANCSLYIREGQDNGDIAGYGQLYCKDNAGTTELWFVDDNGNETQLA